MRFNINRAVLAGIAASVATTLACERDLPATPAVNEPIAAPAPPAQRVVFPDSLRTDDAGVNRFISDALDICARGDYDAFRILWSARQDPISHEEFEQGWEAVRLIQVRAIEKVVLPDREATTTSSDSTGGQGVVEGTLAPDVSIVVFIEVSLDPEHPAGRRQPEREVVLLMVQENNGWRFGRAPKELRAWIKQHADVAANGK